MARPITDDRRLTSLEAAAYGLPSATLAALVLPLVLYLPPFYAEDVGLGLAAVGTIFALTRIWDVVTDPVLGIVSDRFPSRFGRRRHWIVLSVPVLVMSVYALFLPSLNDDGGVSQAYLLGWLILMYIGWTMFNMSHIAWGAELASSYNEKTRVQGWREVFTLGGMLFVLALPAVIASQGGDRTDQVAAMGLFVVISLPITVTLSVLNVGERKVDKPAKVNWRDVAKAVYGNRFLRRVLIGDFAMGVAGGVTAGILLFLLSDVLLVGQYGSLILLITIGVGFLFIPLVVYCAKRFGKHQTMIISLLFDASTLPLLFLVPRGNIFWIIALFALLGINRTAPALCLRSITADVAHHEEVTTGKARTGLYFALIMMTQKLGGAFALFITYVGLDAIGYAPGEANAQVALDWLLGLYVLIPLTLNCVVAAAFWRFPLGRAEIEALVTTAQGSVATSTQTAK